MPITSLLSPALYGGNQTTLPLMSITTQPPFTPLTTRSSLSDTGSGDAAFNVLFPDDHSVYHASLLYIEAGGAFRVHSSELPYARYLSFQTYVEVGGVEHGHTSLVSPC